MNGLIFALALAATNPQAKPAPAPAAVQEPTKPNRLTTKSPLADLMDNAQAKDVVRKYLPRVVDLIDQGGTSQAPPDFSLQSLTEVSRAGVTPDVLKQINDDLAKL